MKASPALIVALVALLALVVPSPGPLGAREKTTVEAVYEISIAGWGIARASLDLTLAGSSYDARLFMKPKGVARIVTAVRTSVAAAGEVRRGTVLPSRYSVRADEIDRPVAVDMTMRGGAVAAVDATPPLKEKPGRVPVTNAHRRGIVDPLSSGLIPIARADGRDACDHTLKIFDGWTRYDVRFAYDGTVPVATKGYEGRAVVCRARWVPVSGHRPAKREVQYLANNKALAMWVVPVPGENVAIPYQVTIGTPNGEIKIVPSLMRMSGPGV